MKKVILAFQFLTIIPIKASVPVDEADIAKSSGFFVLVGLFQGFLLVASDYILGMVFHPDLVIGIIVLIYVLSNGGFHLDGLADTFDAVAAKSEGDREKDRQKRLAVMRDSATGPIGVTAIIFALLLKYLALKNISHFSPFIYYSSITLMPVFSKWAMVVSMFYGKPARTDGLGRLFIGKLGFKEIVISTSMLLLLLILAAVFSGSSMSNNYFIFYAVVLLAIYFICLFFVNFCQKKFSGLTGDTLGAISEIAEIIFLLMGIIWLRLYI